MYLRKIIKSFYICFGVDKEGGLIGKLFLTHVNYILTRDHKQIYYSEVSVLGSPELKKVFFKMYVCMQGSRESY